MNIEDMILVSVDDHVVEPPDMFEGRLAGASTWTSRPGSITKDDGNDVWLYEGQELPNIGLNAVSGRPPEEYGIEPTVVRRDAPRLLRHRPARRRHERQRRARFDVLPVVPAVLRPAVRRARRTRTLGARACCRPTTTGTSTSGAGPTPVASSRSRCPCCGIPSSPPTRSAGSRPRAATPSRSRRTPRSSATRASTATTGTRSGRPCEDEGTDRVPAHRLVVGAGDHVDRGADQRDDHAAADEHRAGGGRPAVVAGAAEVPRPSPRAVRGRHRLDPVLPRAGRLRLQAPQGVDGPGPRRCCRVELFQERIVTCFIDDAVGRRDPGTTSAST